MKKRNIMILLLILVITLIAVFISIYQNIIKEAPTSTYIANVSKVLNQGGSILEYDNKAFIVGEHIYSYNMKNKKIDVITNSSYKDFYDKMYILHNNLLYTSNNKTYAYNLSTGIITEIIDGCLEYADEQQYIYTMNKGGKEYLYFSSYDKSNMAINNDVMYNLAYGTDIFFIRKQDDMLLFGAKNSRNVKSIFYVDISKKRCEVLVDACNIMSLDDYVVSDAVKFEDNNTGENCIYFIAGLIENNSLISYIKNYNLYLFNSINKTSDLQSSYIGSAFCTDSNGKLYAQGVEDDKTIYLDMEDSLEKKIINAKDILGNMKLSMSIVDGKLYFEDIIIGDVTIGSVITDVWHIGDNYYIKCSSKDGMNLYLYNEDLVKIY